MIKRTWWQGSREAELRAGVAFCPVGTVQCCSRAGGLGEPWHQNPQLTADKSHGLPQAASSTQSMQPDSEQESLNINHQAFLPASNLAGQSLSHACYSFCNSCSVCRDSRCVILLNNSLPLWRASEVKIWTKICKAN